jgi:hypothetical protein
MSAKLARKPGRFIPTLKAQMDKLDRSEIIDTVADVMAQSYRAWSIDQILTHPHDAIDMSTIVLRRLKRTVNNDSIHDICRIALGARKAGRLRAGAGRPEGRK